MAERPISTGRELFVTQARVIESFLGKEVFLEPPQGLLEFVERTTEMGFTFEPYLEPNITLSQDAQYPGWHKKPGSYFYDFIRKGDLPPKAMRLSLMWAAMETIVRPSDDRGLQLHKNDALAPHLEDLRKQGQIEVPHWLERVPSISRFGVSPKEVSGPVVARFAEIAQVDIKNVNIDAPDYKSFNYFGHAHPEFGEANSWEIFADRLRGGNRLIGGYSDHGGLSNVYGWTAYDHNQGIAFRLRVGFPPKSYKLGPERIRRMNS